MLFGLIGKNISYSFSQGYFTKKFKELKLSDNTYRNFDIDDINAFPKILTDFPQLKGLNVTIPYKEQIMEHLDKLDEKAKKIGAVNTIKISKKGKLTGYNTDCYGFKKSLAPHLKFRHKRALILGTGGASKAIAFVLSELKIKYQYVSRTPKKGQLSYDMLDEKTIARHLLIINCSPVGTFPDIEACPDIPYEHITEKHLLYDLIYNPPETRFLKNGKAKGASICNGLKMLELQAEKAWNIWNN